MDKRLSISIGTAAVSLVAGILLLVVGPRRDDTQDARVAAVVGELDARIRETSAGVQARAITLSQLPRLGWAVSTDPTTVRDLTADELAFRPLPGESIEIAQIQIKTGQALTLLRAPPGDTLKLPVTETGQRLLVDGDRLYVAAILAIPAHERADEIRGAVVVAERLDLATVVQRLDALRTDVRIETAEAALVLGSGTAPKAARAAATVLGSPAAQTAKVTVLTPPGGFGGHPVPATLVILLGFAVAGVLWMRARRTAHDADQIGSSTRASPPSVSAALTTPSPVPPATTGPRQPPATVAAPPPSPSPSPILGPPPARAAPPALPLPSGSRPASDRRPTPQVPMPSTAPPASDRRATPLVPLPTLAASGKYPLPLAEADAKRPSQVLAEAEITAVPEALIVDEMSTTLTTLNADLARVTDRGNLGVTGASTTSEYRELFREFVKLRRTCGEPTEGLDPERFVVVLEQKRAELMARHAYKEVRFWVGFNDGKAVVRSQGIR